MTTASDSAGGRAWQVGVEAAAAAAAVEAAGQARRKQPGRVVGNHDSFIGSEALGGRCSRDNCSCPAVDSTQRSHHRQCN